MKHRSFGAGFSPAAGMTLAIAGTQVSGRFGVIGGRDSERSSRRAEPRRIVAAIVRAWINAHRNVDAEWAALRGEELRQLADALEWRTREHH